MSPVGVLSYWRRRGVAQMRCPEASTKVLDRKRTTSTGFREMSERRICLFFFYTIIELDLVGWLVGGVVFVILCVCNSNQYA